MSYSGTFRIRFDAGSDSVEQINEYMQATETSDQQLFYAHVTGDAESFSWRRFEEDMRALSARFPHALFTLDEEGEYGYFRYFFKGGKMQNANARVVYDDFDPEKLT